MKIKFFKKAFGLIVALLMCGAWGAVKAQGTELIIMPGNLTYNADGDCWCLDVNDMATFSFNSSGVNNQGDAFTVSNATWLVQGGLLETDDSNNSVSVINAQGTDFLNNFSRYGKGRIELNAQLVNFRSVNVSNPGFTIPDCVIVPPGCDFTSQPPSSSIVIVRYYTEVTEAVYICKQFSIPDNLHPNSPNNAIVGPVCITPGDSVTFSVAPWVSLVAPREVGFDIYNWFPGGVPSFVQNQVLYFSADKSSVTFVVGELTGNDVIAVQIGCCNVADPSTTLSLQLAQGAADPIFNKDLDNYCLPFGAARDTIIITNPQPGVTYEWNFRSWTVNHRSLQGDTIIFSPQNNAQTVSMQMVGGCAERSFIFEFNRSVNPADSIRVVGNTNCLPANTLLEFYVDNVPVGTEMEWTVQGEGWSISTDEARKARPTIRTGTGQGVVTATARGCNGTAIMTFDIMPATPGVISGPTCLDFGDTEIKTFSIAPVANATSYEWRVPNGWLSNNSTTNVLEATPNGINGGQILVRAIGCGMTNWRVINVNLKPEEPRGVITACINYGMEGTTTFTVIPADNAPSGLTYSWIIPVGLGSIVSSNADSSVVTINTIGIAGNFTVQVKAINNCGESDFVSETVVVETIYRIDSQTPRPGPQTGARREIYVEYADYTWIDISNYMFTWYINGQFVVENNSDIIEISEFGGGGSIPFPEAFPNGNAEVIITAPSGCKSKMTLHWGARGARANISSFESSNDVKEDINLSYGIMIVPNPASDIVRVILPAVAESSVRLFSMDGKLIEQKQVNSSEVEFDVFNLPNGTYIVSVIQNGRRYSKQLIIQK